MQRDYNDGKWHGWNGGECPVHPKSRVKTMEENGLRWEADAARTDWESFRGAFRVVEPYHEPREYVAWQVVYPSGSRSGFPCLDQETANALARQIGGRVIKLTGRDDG